MHCRAFLGGAVLPRFLFLFGLLGGTSRAILLASAVAVLITLLAALWATFLARFLSPRGAALAGRLVAARGRCFFQLVGFFLVFEFQKVGYVEERVALQTHIHEGRLHAGQDAGDATVVNRPGQGVLVFAFVVDFRELIVFKNCKPRLMRRAGDANLYCHRTFPPGGVCQPGLAARLDREARGRKERGCAEGMTRDSPVCRLLGYGLPRRA